MSQKSPPSTSPPFPGNEPENDTVAKSTRVGLVGCGFFSRNHVHSWRDLAPKGARLVAVCDLDKTKAEAVAAEFGIEAYDDMARMISEAELDLVDVVTQVGSHRHLVETALGMGTATIVQKPFGLNLDDCRAMMELSERTGVFLAVHENFRFQSPSRQVKAALEEGRIGKPNWGRIAFRTGYDVFAGQPYLREEERFVITDLGTHVLDLARYFFGEVTHLSAETQTRLDNVRGEDTATMLLRHVSGAVSVVECTYASFQDPDPFPANLIEIEGSEGALRVGGDLVLHISGSETVEQIDTGVALRDWAERPWHVVQDSVYRTCEQILESYRAGVPAETSAADNVKTYALCEAAYESVRRNAKVTPAV